ncbi:MAG TPA: hypothetical protein VMU34_08010 [Mycobacterium sp.]|nr:hypothetical protein [Mycobacterium sp.]
MTKCPQCHREGHHTLHCPRGRCQRCRRAPATIGPSPTAEPVWCGPCSSAVMRERKKIVAERLAHLDEDR